MIGSIWEKDFDIHWKVVRIGIERGPGGRLSLDVAVEKRLIRDLRMKQRLIVTTAMNQTSFIG